MKKITLISLLLTTYIFSNINAVVSILPEKMFVEAIGGDKINVSLMVLPGNSPHTYEPKPSQMKLITQAKLYFAINVEFERAWLPKFRNLNSKMIIIDLSKNIEKIQMQEAHNVQAQHDEHEHKGQDPHIWTAPTNVKIIAENIYDTLVKADPENQNYYKNNLDKFLLEIDRTDRQIKQILSTVKNGKKFMVFHPSWGYFANAYGLEQIAVEVEGKEPKPKELMHILKEAKEEKVKAIFTQPEFSDSVAKVIGKELGIPVIKVSPMAGNWSENLIDVAKAIAGKD